MYLSQGADRNSAMASAGLAGGGYGGGTSTTYSQSPYAGATLGTSYDPALQAYGGSSGASAGLTGMGATSGMCAGLAGSGYGSSAITGTKQLAGDRVYSGTPSYEQAAAALAGAGYDRDNAQVSTTEAGVHSRGEPIRQAEYLTSSPAMKATEIDYSQAYGGTDLNRDGIPDQLQQASTMCGSAPSPGPTASCAHMATRGLLPTLHRSLTAKATQMGTPMEPWRRRL